MADLPIRIPDVVIPYGAKFLPLSNAEKVRNFTEDSSLVPLPAKPQVMNPGPINFVIKMVMTEMIELMLTEGDVTYDKHTTHEIMQNILREAIADHFTAHPEPYKRPMDPAAIIADQADAMVDAMYYMYNAASKVGVDLDKVFEEVHQANERKRGPDGKFQRRADGKIIKPAGWTEPDVVSVIKKQMNP
jgi:predicted HAD superfamily Cof-like phosphohydrolase